MVAHFRLICNPVFRIISTIVQIVMMHQDERPSGMQKASFDLNHRSKKKGIKMKLNHRLALLTVCLAMTATGNGVGKDGGDAGDAEREAERSRMQDRLLNDWASTRFGRISPHPGFWSMNVEVVNAFQPSGVGCGVYRFNDYLILHNHGLYYGSEDPMEYDMHACVMIFKGNQRVFVARGYRYNDFEAKYNPITSDHPGRFVFKHWTGVMGDEQITVFDLTLDEADMLHVRTYELSTKD